MVNFIVHSFVLPFLNRPFMVQDTCIFASLAMEYLRMVVA